MLSKFLLLYVIVLVSCVCVYVSGTVVHGGHRIVISNSAAVCHVLAFHVYVLGMAVGLLPPRCAFAWTVE